MRGPSYCRCGPCEKVGLSFLSQPCGFFMNKRSKSYCCSLFLGQEGYSLVEVLLVLALSGLIAGFAGSVYLFVERSLGDWKQRDRLQAEAQVLLQAISRDLYRAKEIYEISPHSVGLLTDDFNSRVYSFDSRELMLNEKPLGSAVGDIVAFEVAGKRAPDFFLANQSDHNHTNGIEFITIKLAIAGKEDTLRLQRSVYLRGPTSWKPIPEN